MTRSSASPRSPKDIYQEITNQVIAALEKGVALWRKPWTTQRSIPKGNFPINIATQKHYKGWNHTYLSWITLAQAFSAPYFLTFKQAHAMGGRIKKGCHGFQIVRWIPKEKTEIVFNPKTQRDELTVTELRFIPAFSTVFNIDQTEGITVNLPIIQPTTPKERIDLCENMVAGMPNAPEIREEGQSAMYFRFKDLVQIPAIHLFRSPEEYYSTLFHELVHSTGHEKRLNRPDLIEHDGIGGKNYSHEELTAEMGAAYLCGVAGIEQKTIDNSAAYLQGWLKKLRDDKKLILTAALKAQAAADYILNERLPKQPDPEETPATSETHYH